MTAASPLVLAASTETVTSPRMLRFYLALHCAWFALYAFLGKGFAYAGWQPFYVGEALLLASMIVLLRTRRLSALVLSPIGGVMICFLLWQVSCAVPYLEDYGIDTLRDSVLWGYALFAWVVAALILRIPRSVREILTRYRRFASAYLVIGPAAWMATLYLSTWLPAWPGTRVTIPLLKGDDYQVALAGVFAFSLQGLGGRSWWGLLILADAMLGMNVRSGLVAFVCAGIFVLLLRPKVRRFVVVLFVGFALIVTMAAFDFRISPPGSSREFSLSLLSQSLVSVVGDSERNDLESTKGWRLAWWRAIEAYTINGPYFWTGKGYGINLADSDGFQVGTREEPLRSPHSSHLNFLARSGVPGFALWIALQLTWLISLLTSYLRARQLRDPLWPKVFAWIMSYWLAFIVAGAFDVFLEGPMAGIPFWTIFGIGWACHLLFRSQAAQQKRGLAWQA